MGGCLSAKKTHEEGGHVKGSRGGSVHGSSNGTEKAERSHQKDAHASDSGSKEHVHGPAKSKGAQAHSAPDLGSSDMLEDSPARGEVKNSSSRDDSKGRMESRADSGRSAAAAPAAPAPAAGSGSNRVQDSPSGQSSLTSYTYEELVQATDNFNQGRKLGEGGFGSVYWGELDVEDSFVGRSGRAPVAIKILNEDGLQGHKEWLAEVTLLGSLRHPHLVRLIGWCAEGTSRLLVYEYMPNGSLDVLLHPLPGSNDAVPPWGLRMEIALGVAKCLEYLHEGRDRPIIYRDLKSANVLLDEDYKAKLADFGLAKDGPVGDKTHVTTQVVGTHGYADPDYIITGHLTPKSDVYGFGVLMLELITGRHALNDEDEEGATDTSGMGYEGEEEDLAEWAVPYLDDRRRIVEIVDRRIADSVPQRGLVKAALLSRQCINDSPYERPQMSSIVKTLLSIQHPYQWPPS